MAHISGSVNSFREALVEIRLKGVAIECVVDTGFDGGLMLPRTLADRLQIPLIGRLTLEMVNGSKMIASVRLADIEWLEETREIEVIFSDGNDALVGTELLTGTTLTIDYATRVVKILKSGSV